MSILNCHSKLYVLELAFAVQYFFTDVAHITHQTPAIVTDMSFHSLVFYLLLFFLIANIIVGAAIRALPPVIWAHTPVEEGA